MPPNNVPDWHIASGNCGNPRQRGSGKGAARAKAAQLAEAAEAGAAENALIAKIGKFRWDPVGHVGFAFP
jgi:hypothetical protein